MPRVNGVPFRCSCGCNCFHHPSEKQTNIYECNACGAWYDSDAAPAPSDTPPHDNSHWGETCPHPDCVKERAASSGSVPETTATKARPSDSKTNEELLDAFENAVDGRAKTEIDNHFEEQTLEALRNAEKVAASAKIAKIPLPLARHIAQVYNRAASLDPEVAA